MNRLFHVAYVSLVFLSACGGTGGSSDSGSGSGNPSTGTFTPVQFKDLVGTTPADAALGQSLEVQWVLPNDLSIASVELDATAMGGAGATRTSCVVTAGALAKTATSGSITIPNTCSNKTVNEVQLRVTVNGTAGQKTTATHAFMAPAAPEAFLPKRLNLSLLRVTTDNAAPIVSKDVYIPGQMSLESNVAGTAAMTGPLQIRGRGNSTWGMPKKPYRVKLTDKQSLLGMPSSKDWVLLANYSDKSLLRNALAMELGTRMGMPWTPRSGFVELYLNDRYDGVYLLSENIKVAKDRVNIDQLAAADVSADKITGGYLLEVDFRQDGHTMFSSIDQLPIVFQDPEEPVQAQEDYISGYINQFEAALHSSGFADPTTGYAAYIDVDSFVRWFLVNELFRNVDANMGTSCWMYKPRGGKLHMGPLWDFDLAAGNANYSDSFKTDGWRIRTAPWFSRLFEDPAFVARVKQVWNEIKVDQLPAMMQSISANATLLQQSRLNNFQRWPILEMYVWPNYMIPGSYSGEIGYLNTWLTARITWLDGQFNP